MNKRGLSEVVTTVLIILLVLAAVIIIWMFTRAAIQSGSGQVDAGLFTSVLEIKGQSVGVDSDLRFRNKPAIATLKPISLRISSWSAKYFRKTMPISFHVEIEKNP